MTRNSPEFLESVQAYIERNKAENPLFGSTPEMVEDIKKDLWQQARGLFRTIEPGQNRVFRFTGLEDAKRLGLPLTLRFRINAGGNRPDELYNVQFLFQGIPLPEQSVPPGTIRTITIPLPNLINPDGTAELMAVNGRLVRMNDAAGSLGVLPNADLMTFDIKEGLELSFKAGGFTGNLAKVGLVLWLKLAFLAMLGVCLATFLNFPVACLVAFSMFLAAESAGFLATSLEYYDALDPITREVSYWKIPVRMIGLAMSWLFGNYAALEPTTSLVDGKLITMLALSRGSVILIVFVAVLFTIATLVFSRRELATYSGH
jgi:hypothetical protein